MRGILGLVAVTLGAAALAGAAAADAVYRTERLELTGVAGAPGGGMVVNVHTDGPQVYAYEIYTLRDAVPETYQVTLNVFPTSLDCTGTALAFPTAALDTNARGNGQADVKFTPEDVTGFRGMTVSLSWTVTGPATYVTGCTVSWCFRTRGPAVARGGVASGRAPRARAPICAPHRGTFPNTGPLERARLRPSLPTNAKLHCSTGGGRGLLQRSDPQGEKVTAQEVQDQRLHHPQGRRYRRGRGALGAVGGGAAIAARGDDNSTEKAITGAALEQARRPRSPTHMKVVSLR